MTTAILELEEAKRWLRVDHDEDDLLIESLILDATELVETRLRRPVVGGENAVCESVSDVPASIKLAALGLVALKYENRDATSDDVSNRLLTNAGLDRFIDWGA